MRAAVLMLLLPFFVAAREPELRGHWNGTVPLASGKKRVEFDLLEAPCAWGQPDETPFLLHLTSGDPRVLDLETPLHGSPSLALLDVEGSSSVATRIESNF